jgi:hypothetical protein
MIGEDVRGRILALVERFREKGATSPDRAMTLEELGLPPRFRHVLHRLGRLGVFVEVDSKYYLSEERLKQIEERRQARLAARNTRSRLLNLRILRVAISILFIALLLVNLFVRSVEVRMASSILLVVLLAISILQLYYLTRTRKSK